MEIVMLRKTLLLSALTALLAGTACLAAAQDAPPPPAAQGAKPMPPHGGMHGPQGWRDHGMRGHGDFGGPGGAVISDLRGLERLYVLAGRTKELPALYDSVLAKSQDPMVRTYVYHHLARLQAQPANVDEAIGTLRKSLDENLANEAKQHAMMEQMRTQWQQKHATGTAPAPAAH